MNRRDSLKLSILSLLGLSPETLTKPFFSLSDGKVTVEWDRKDAFEEPLIYVLDVIDLRHRGNGYQFLQYNCKERDFVTIYVVGEKFVNEIKPIVWNYIDPLLNKILQDPLNVVFNGKNYLISSLDFAASSDDKHPLAMIIHLSGTKEASNANNA